MSGPTPKELGRQLLHAVINAKGLAAVHALAEAGATLDERESDEGGTPLLIALRNEYPAIASYLLGRGAKVNETDDYGATALMWAVYHDDDALFGALLDKGADINAKDANGETALMWAATAGFPANLKALLDRGADMDAVDNEGWTAMDWASAPDILRMLEAAREERRAAAEEGFRKATEAFRSGLPYDITLDPPLTARKKQRGAAP